VYFLLKNLFFYTIGDTTTDNDSDLSADTLSKDVGDIVKEMYGNSPPSVVIMGHR